MGSCVYIYKGKTYTRSDYYRTMLNSEYSRAYKETPGMDDYLIYNGDPYVLKKNKNGKVIQGKMIRSQVINTIMEGMNTTGQPDGFNWKSALSIYKMIKSIPGNPLFTDENGEVVPTFQTQSDRRVISVTMEDKDVVIGYITLKDNKFHHVESTSAYVESQQRERVSREAAERKVDKLKNIFQTAGVTVYTEFDNDLDIPASISQVDDGFKIKVNPTKMNGDEELHEMSHIFLDPIADTKPVQDAINTLKGTLLWDKVQKLYPDYSETRLGIEVLTYAIGNEASRILEDQGVIAKIKRFFEQIYYEAAKFFGISVDNVRYLALRMASGKRLADVFASLEHSSESMRGILNDIDELRKIKLNPNTNQYEYNGNTYERLTEWVQKTFSYTKNQQELAKALAAEKYQELINAGKEANKEELETAELRALKTHGARGWLVHYMMQWYLTDDLNEKQEIIAKMNDIYADTTTHLPIARNTYSWLFPVFTDKEKQDRERNLIRKILLDRLNVNTFYPDIPAEQKDRIETEVPIVHEKLKLGTTFDMIVERPNGDLQIVDWKSGRYRDSYTFKRILKWGEDKVNALPDNSTGRAALELTLRVFALKDLHPDVRFSRIALGYLNSIHFLYLDDVDLQTNLELLRDYFKETDPQAYKEYNKKGLFDAINYGGRFDTLQHLADTVHNLSYEAQIQYWHNKLNGIMATIPGEHRATKEQIAEIKYIQDTLKALYNLPGVAFNSKDPHDTGWMKMYFGAWYELNDPNVKLLGTLYSERKLRRREALNKVKKEFQRLMEPIVRDYYGMNILKKQGFVFSNISKAYAFAYVKRDKMRRDGTTVSETRLVTPVDAEWSALNDDQKALMNFVNTTMKTEYKRIMSLPIYIHGKTKASALDMVPEELEDGFLPIVPIEFSEFMERQPLGMIDKKTIKALFHKNISKFIHEGARHEEGEYYGQQLPLRYMGDSQGHQRRSDLFTMNLETSFLSFMDNLYEKEHLDDVAVLGDSLGVWLHSRGKEFTRTTKFIDHMVTNIIRDVKKGDAWTRRPIEIPFRGKIYQINPEQFFNALKWWTTATVMWLNVFNAGFNMALIIMQNHLEAIKGSIGQLMGIPREDIDITLDTMLWADAQCIKLFGDFLVGRQRHNKLYNMAYQLDYLTDNYDYKIRRSDVMIAKNRKWNSSIFFLFYKIGEDYGNYSILAAMLKGIKNPKTGNSLWEDYDNYGNWKGGLRGKIYIGEDASGKKIFRDLKGLSGEEVNHMKRVSQRLFGSYRSDERMMIEQYSVGRLLMQFKKYLPAILFNMYQGKYRDISLGHWTVDKNSEEIRDENGEKINVYKFQDKLHEGRIKILLKFIASLWNAQSAYRPKNMDNETKLQLINLSLQLAVLFGCMIGFGAGVDDKKDVMALRARRLMLQDIPQGINPQEYFYSINSSFIGIGRLLKLNQAAAEFIFDGVIGGKRTQRGRYPGETELYKYLPFLSIFSGWERYLGEDFNKSPFGQWYNDYLHTGMGVVR